MKQRARGITRVRRDLIADIEHRITDLRMTAARVGLASTIGELRDLVDEVDGPEEWHRLIL